MPGFVIDPDDVLDLITEGFMQWQRARVGDTWLLGLYRQLAGQRSLRSETKSSPVIPLQDGSWTRAWGEDEEPLAWLPTLRGTGVDGSWSRAHDGKAPLLTSHAAGPDTIIGRTQHRLSDHRRSSLAQLEIQSQRGASGRV